MKRIFSVILLFCVLLTNINVSANENDYVYKNDVYLKYISDFDVNGFATIEGQSDKKVKIILKTPNDNTTWYDVDKKNDRFRKKLWFIDGVGQYEISVVVNKSGKTYNYVKKYVFNNLIDLDKDLYPEKYIQSDDEKIKEIANFLNQQSGDEIDNIILIYLWIMDNVEYDYQKYKNILNKDYSDTYGAIQTLETNKGVCLDYATLFTAICRASGIKSRVIKGDYMYSNGSTEYHAWNEVYINQLDMWMKVDITLSDVSNEYYIFNDDMFFNHFAR